MRVKVCGMTQLEQVDRLGSLGATFAGFIFYPKSPRYVLRYMTTSQLRKENAINKVGVFVNSGQDEVLQMVDECRLHMVQLHGDETPKYCERIADYVSVVKAFRLSDNDSIEWMVRPYMDVCDMFLFDTMGVGYGGTGKKFDWNILREVNVGKPYFLSGGIEPGDVQALKEFAVQAQGKGFFAIDVNSKFETSPGVKDLDLVGNFINDLNKGQ
ncbi:phosphoribosylanthranilate isomerase [Flavihumibacter rivuli]|uniref:phosphoribosylanthranilate isomerase n=1 Tax=Flavihumibacter rivuli TaxID=2838156 RepID=UPI001BDE0FFA|nr:phosphoribosylanthranilate isomerase [Flavihumibacter rivuli]ULQ57227.1 phosphoribosylanthranilate isomerase [Flavihumibacter rivuli]